MALYFECEMGAAGDMLMASLYALVDDKPAVLEGLNSLGLPNTIISFEEKQSCGITGLHARVIVGGSEEKCDAAAHRQHSHRSLSEVLDIIKSLNAPEKVINDACEIYKLIAGAEAEAHNMSVGEVHFHELGMLDAIADITACAYLMHYLAPDIVYSSTVNVGNGTVRCPHGVLPVPAPATANILMNSVPYKKSDINCELCTPTGAAIIRYYTDIYTDDIKMNMVHDIGIGVGTRELERANIIRCFQFEAENVICELSCNIDDMTGEEISYACEKINEAAPLDCFVTPIIMKKGRPAEMLTVLCKAGDKEKFASLIFKHTQTLGIRTYSPSRFTLERELETINTPYGSVLVKNSYGYNTEKSKPEFEDVKKIADKYDVSIRKAREMIMNKSE